MNRKIQMSRHKRQLVKSKKLNESKEVHEEPAKDVIEHSMRTANKMWNDIKKRVKDNPDFVNYSDSKKVEIYSSSEFSEFYTAFPIVSRYMICMGQFTNKAFKRFLLKCKNMQNSTRFSKNKEEDWTKRQADYVRYLWESYQTQTFSSNESQQIWQHAYQTLKQEFKDFSQMKDDTEKRLETEGKNNKAEVVKEMLKRMANKEQSLDEATSEKLLQKLKTALIIQNRNKLISQIDSDVERTRPTRF